MRALPRKIYLSSVRHSKILFDHPVDVPYHILDFKKMILELSLVCNVYDTVSRDTNFLFELKIGNELIAKWSQRCEKNKLIKKFRFPFKFKYLNSNVNIMKF